MSVLTTLRIANSFGVHLTEVADYGSLDVVLNASPGGIGVLEVTLPLSFNAAFLLEDGRIGVYRSINGRPPYLDNGAIFMIRYIDFGPDSIFVRALHATNILIGGLSPTRPVATTAPKAQTLPTT